MESHSTVVPAVPYGRSFSWKGRVVSQINTATRKFGFELAKVQTMTDEDRDIGRGWSLNSETMIGRRRLEQLHEAMHLVRSEGLKGDFMETGVWRGGASMYMAAFNRIYNLGRRIIAADSFRGLPSPNPNIEADAGAVWHDFSYLSVSIDDVKENFETYGRLDDKVIFVPGFFSESLKGFHFEPLSILRLDGDLYESTMDVLTYAYDAVVPGGFVIVDHYYLENAQRAVSDFLSSRAISVELHAIDFDAVYWRKPT